MLLNAFNRTLKRPVSYSTSYKSERNLRILIQCVRVFIHICIWFPNSYYVLTFAKYICNAFTADNFGHRVQSIYQWIRQLKSTKHHTKNTQPKKFQFCTFYLHSETHQNLKIIDSYSFIRKCNISQSILKESLLKKVWSQRLMCS